MLELVPADTISTSIRNPNRRITAPSVRVEERLVRRNMTAYETHIRRIRPRGVDNESRNTRGASLGGNTYERGIRNTRTYNYSTIHRRRGNTVSVHNVHNVPPHSTYSMHGSRLHSVNLNHYIPAPNIDIYTRVGMITRAITNDLDLSQLYPQLLSIQPRVLTQEQINKTFRERYYCEIYDDSINNSCSICMEEFEMDDKCRMLNCKHSFHVKCIDRWFKYTKANCALCRKEIN